MELSPEVLKMRDALLERIGEKPLKDVAQIVNEILLNETNSTNRLAALSARVKVLRDYINKNYDIKRNLNKKNTISKNNNIELKPEIEKEVDEKNNSSNTAEAEAWVRVEMLKSGVVNGVRFPQGVIIDVSHNDAEKLVAESLSKIIEIENDSTEEITNDTKGNEEKSNPEETPKPTKAEDQITKTETKGAVKDQPLEKVVEKSNPEETPKPTKAEDQITKTETKGAVKDQPLEKKADLLNSVEQEDKKEIENLVSNKKILRKKSTKITEETIELTDPKAVAEALGLNEKKKKEELPREIEEEIDIEALETGKKL